MAFALSDHVGLNLGPLPGLSGAKTGLNLGVEWDDNVEPPEPVVRGLRAGAALPWARAGRRLRHVRTGWQESEKADARLMLGWGTSAPMQRSHALPWSASPSARRQLLMSWQAKMSGARGEAQLSWQLLPLVNRGASLPWRELELIEAQRQLRWNAPPLSHAVRDMRWGGSIAQRSAQHRLRWLAPGLSKCAARLPWGEAPQVPWIVRPPVVSPPDPEPEAPFPPGNRVGLNLGCAPIGRAGLAPLNLDVTECYLVRPQRRTFVVINTVSVVRLPDRTPIEVESLGITGSVDAWGFSFDLELASAAQLDLLRPTASGPRSIEVALNGYVWTAIVESYSTRREWQGGGVTLSGRSRTALLAAPYAPARAKASTEERTVAQLVDEELADTGYLASYDTVDWAVPAGAWFYDATTPLDAISKLAEASGAVVQSDPEAEALRIRARYPSSPWDWPTTAPDATIQDDVVITESLQIRSMPQYDAVVVTGELAGKGVTCRVRRAGEAGTLYAAQVTSPLISVAEAGAERGRNVLSDRGEQAAIDLVLPLFAAPLGPGEVGRILPLDLVEVQTAQGTWHGLCTSVRIDARMDDKACVIEQTITLERHYTDAN